MTIVAYTSFQCVFIHANCVAFGMLWVWIVCVRALNVGKFCVFCGHLNSLAPKITHKIAVIFGYMLCCINILSVWHLAFGRCFMSFTAFILVFFWGGSAILDWYVRAVEVFFCYPISHCMNVYFSVDLNSVSLLLL